MALVAGESLAFTIPAHGTRGRLVRLGPGVDEILGTHAYPPAVAQLLAEALVLTALLGSLLVAEGGQLTLQVRGEDSLISLLVTDYRQGELRGYAALDLDRRLPFPEAGGELRGWFGDGHLMLTVDRLSETASPSERYQGIVELDAPTLQEAAARYFSASEQVPTLVRLAALRDAEGQWQAAGLLLQKLPDEQDGADGMADFEHVAILGESVRDSELTDSALAADMLLWRLFHEQRVHLFPAEPLRRGCRCSSEHIQSVLARFSEDERAEMRNIDGQIAVDCEFCAKQFLFDL